MGVKGLWLAHGSLYLMTLKSLESRSSAIGEGLAIETSA